MPEIFRVGLTRDFLKVDGSLAFRDIGFDLTNSLGIPADFEHPTYLAAVERVLDACRQNSRAAGFMVASPEEARAKLDQGFRCLAYWGDLWIYQQALSAAMQRIRSEGATSLEQ